MPMPFPILVRKARPWVSKLAILVWLLYRLFTPNQHESLLQLLMEYLQLVQDGLRSIILEYPYAEMLLPLTQWSWRVFEDVLAIIVLLGANRVLYCLYHYSWNEWKLWMVQNIFDWAAENVPMVQAELTKQTDAFNAKADDMLHKNPKRTITSIIPEVGRSRDDLIQELEFHAVQEDQKWKSGTVSGTVYSNDPEHTQFMNKVYAIYAWSNPLHPGSWPKLNQCEGEVISMTADMLHGPPIGCVTSGGTESILLAVRAHANYYGKRRGIQYPEIVCGSTAHAALNKACDMFGIRQVSIDCDDGHSYRLDPRKVRRHITSNTIMIYSSAPSYPQGVVDPIEELSEIALEYDIGLHVDACLGGFVLPFCKDAPVFDFRNTGVTSMSADTHKYGYASKGSSVVMYRSRELRHGMYFSYAHWTGGCYSTPTFAGSRPGALSACAWAALVSLGQQGYRERAELIVRATREIAEGVRTIPGIKLMTPNPFMVVCFGSDELDIYRIQDHMTTAGWGLNSLQSPASVHLCVTLNVVPKAKSFLKDLRNAVELARKEGDAGGKKGIAGIYGTVGSLPAGPVECTLKAFTDMTLAP